MFNFLKKIKDSMYGPAFYQDLLAKPLSFSFKYYYSLVCLITVIITINLSFAAVPAVNAFLKSISPIISKHFPHDLEITIQNGKVLTNVTEPYFIKIPDEWKGRSKKNAGRSEKIANILVIDTKNNFDLEQFYKYETAVLLTRDALVYRDKNKVSMNSLKGIGNLKISHAMLVGLIDKISPYFVIAPPVVVCTIFLGIFLWLGVFKLIYLFFLAVLIVIAAKIKKLPVGYSNAYKVSLHLITFSFLVGSGLYVFGLSRVQFPFLSTILNVILAFVNLRKVPEITIETGASSPDGMVPLEQK